MERIFSRLTLILLLLFFSLNVFITATDYKDAVVKYRNGDYQGALRIMIPYSNRYPDWEFAHRLIGMCYFKMGKYEKAVKALEKATSLNSSEGSVYLALAESYFDLGDYENALSSLKKGKKFLSSKRDFYLFYKIEGLIYYKLENCNKCIDSILKSFSFKSGDEKDYFHLGACYLKLKKYDDAESALKKSLEINPYFGPSFKILMRLKLKKAENLMKSKDFYGAISLFKEYIKRFPNSPEVKLNLALCYISVKDFESARKLLLEVVKNLPQNYKALFYAGYVFERENDFKQALYYYRKAKNILKTKEVLTAIKRVKLRLK